MFWPFNVLFQNFLGGQVEDDQEYFSIPVDDSLLNSSLCSSLSSLCASRDLQSAVNERNKSGVSIIVKLYSEERIYNMYITDSNSGCGKSNS